MNNGNLKYRMGFLDSQIARGYIVNFLVAKLVIQLVFVQLMITSKVHSCFQGILENYDDIVVTVASSGALSGLAIAKHLTGATVR